MSSFVLICDARTVKFTISANRMVTQLGGWKQGQKTKITMQTIQKDYEKRQQNKTEFTSKGVYKNDDKEATRKQGREGTASISPKIGSGNGNYECSSEIN